MKLLLILLATVSFSATAQVYKWTDANGVTHFGQQPPPGQQERIDVKPASGSASGNSGGAESDIIRQARKLDRRNRQEAIDRQQERVAAAANARENSDPEDSWGCEYAKEQIEEYEIDLRELGRKGYKQWEKDQVESWLAEAERERDRDCN